jgi:hypothetical protein
MENSRSILYHFGQRKWKDTTHPNGVFWGLGHIPIVTQGNPKNKNHLSFLHRVA